MKYLSRLFLCTSLCLILSCEEETYVTPTVNETESIKVDEQEFAKKLENPYTLENMQSALDSINFAINKGNIKDEKGGVAFKPGNFQIQANMLYVKFTPQTPQEEMQLKRDTTLALIDYPLGYEYSDEYFLNRTPLGENEIPVYYTTVSPNKVLPEGVAYEVLEEMYIPTEDSYFQNVQDLTSKTGIISNKTDFGNHLMHQALKQTNNLELDGLNDMPDPLPGVIGIRIGSRWRPEGTIRIWDGAIGTTTTSRQVFVRYEWYDCGGNGGDDGDGNYYKSNPTNLDNPKSSRDSANGRCRRAVYRTEYTTVPGSYVPLDGAQILLRDTFTIGNAITNTSGYYRFGTKVGKLRYIIQWERYQYSIRDGRLFQAEYRGPKQNRRWDYDLKGGEHEYFGHIHRAAHYYYYGNIAGLKRPPNNFTNRQTKIAAAESCCSGVNEYYLPYLTGGIWPTITIKQYGASTPNIFGVTIHEISHSTHAAAAPIIFPIAEKRMRETYANTIEWFLTTRYYSARIPGYEYDNYQDRYIGRRSNDAVYTGLMVDLIDNYNQQVERSDSRLPFDRVSGYSIQDIEKYVFKNATFGGLKEDLQRNLSNPTEPFLTELFDEWQ
ncbi:MAG: hypothetical protein AAFU57_08425 [Bacteroidota bacterium]